MNIIAFIDSIKPWDVGKLSCFPRDYLEVGQYKAPLIRLYLPLFSLAEGLKCPGVTLQEGMKEMVKRCLRLHLYPLLLRSQGQGNEQSVMSCEQYRSACS